jgi:hypothetical protein
MSAFTVSELYENSQVYQRRNEMDKKLKLKANLKSVENIGCDLRKEEITKIFLEGARGVKASLSVKNGLYVDRNAFRKVFRKITGGYPKDKQDGGVEVIYLEGRADTGRDVVLATFAHGIYQKGADSKTQLPVFVIKSEAELKAFHPTESDRANIECHGDHEVIEEYFGGGKWAKNPAMYYSAWFAATENKTVADLEKNDVEIQFRSLQAWGLKTTVDEFFAATAAKFENVPGFKILSAEFSEEGASVSLLLSALKWVGTHHVLYSIYKNTEQWALTMNKEGVQEVAIRHIYVGDSNIQYELDDLAKHRNHNPIPIMKITAQKGLSKQEASSVLENAIPVSGEAN